MTPLRDDMISLMKFCPWSVPELAGELRTSESAVRRAMGVLVAQGNVRVIGTALHSGKVRRSRVLSYGLAA